MKDLLKELVETPGISGNEKPIRQLIKSKVSEHVDSMETDDFGNLVVKKGSGDKTLMIDAHMDQIGMGVRRIDDEGFIRISRIGGAYPISIVNQRVTVHTSHGEDLTGVIGGKPSHLIEENGDNLPTMDKAFVDVGAKDAEDLREKGVRVGDYISFDRGFKELSNDYVTGPAFDNRIGCAIAIKAIENFDSDEYELVAVFSAQEEVGGKGAKTSTFDVDPNAALVLETARAGDVPNMDVDESDEHTGRGFGLTMMEAGGRGVITPEKVRNWLLETADNGGFNYQRKLYDKGKTNASKISTSRNGIPTGVIVIPTRHIHSPVEVIKMSDAEEAVSYMNNVFDTFTDHF